MDFQTREERQKFYQSKEWKALRSYVLAQKPFCNKCRTEGKLVGATVVDHIIDIKYSPENRLNIDNLTTYCKHCHDSKTNKGRSSFMKAVTQQTLLNRYWKLK